MIGADILFSIVGEHGAKWDTGAKWGHRII